MCDHKEREAAMTTVAVDAVGKPTVWCDPCLASLVKALNDGGISTVASCCGHGTHVGSVALSDGRWIVVMTAEDWARFDNRRGTVADTKVKAAAYAMYSAECRRQGMPGPLKSINEPGWSERTWSDVARAALEAAREVHP